MRGVLAGVALLCASAPAWAEVKVGFVNVPKVLDQAPQARAADKRLEKEFGLPWVFLDVPNPV